MTGISTLQADLDRLEKDLAAVEDEYTADGWSEPEKLMFTLQRTASTYRRQVLPRIAADRGLILPPLPDGEAPTALAAYSTIIADELSRLVDQLDELRRDLVRSGQTAQIQSHATEVLAATRAIGTVVLRFGQEVELPSLSARVEPGAVQPAARPQSTPMRRASNDAWDPHLSWGSRGTRPTN